MLIITNINKNISRKACIFAKKNKNMEKENSISSEIKTNEAQEFRLIDGSFTPAEAGNVLFSLISSKIRFHNLEELRHFEQVPDQTSHSKKRIAELENFHSVLKKIIQTAEDQKKKLEITGEITIRFK
jgi:hypothetical protein